MVYWVVEANCITSFLLVSSFTNKEKRRNWQGNYFSGCFIQLASDTNISYATRVTTLSTLCFLCKFDALSPSRSRNTFKVLISLKLLLDNSGLIFFIAVSFSSVPHHLFYSWGYYCWTHSRIWCFKHSYWSRFTYLVCSVWMFRLISACTGGCCSPSRMPEFFLSLLCWPLLKEFWVNWLYINQHKQSQISPSIYPKVWICALFVGRSVQGIVQECVTVNQLKLVRYLLLSMCNCIILSTYSVHT